MADASMFMTTQPLVVPRVEHGRRITHLDSSHAMSKAACRGAHLVIYLNISGEVFKHARWYEHFPVGDAK